MELFTGGEIISKISPSILYLLKIVTDNIIKIIFNFEKYGTKFKLTSERK